MSGRNTNYHLTSRHSWAPPLENDDTTVFRKPDTKRYRKTERVKRSTTGTELDNKNKLFQKEIISNWQKTNLNY